MKSEMISSENRLCWASHRTQDPTGLLKIHINLKRIELGSGQKFSKKKETEEEEEGTEGKPLKDLDEQEEAPISIDIDWQQKLFSPTEVSGVLDGLPLSKNLSLSNKYAEQIRKKREESPSYRGSVIFTKVSEDRYIDPSEKDTPFFGKMGSRKPNELANAVLDGRGNEEMVEVVRLNAQSMHVFASIMCKDGRVHEELIGIIRVFPGGRIDVRPPFSNKANTEYKFFTPTNELVRYTFNVVESSSENETPFEHALLNDIKRRRAVFEAGQINSSLAQPPDPPGTIRMFYRGEIAKAKMDSAEGVAVEYQLKLPAGWANEESGIPIEGCSQYSLCNKAGVANINLPIDLVARCQSQFAPTLMLTLHSYSPNGSRVVEGYGTCSLPMTQGTHQIEVNVWRIRGRVSEELRLIFLESGLEQQTAVEVAEDEYSNISADTVSNKFGLRTVGTGKVIVRFNLVMQSSLFGKPTFQQSGGALSALSMNQSSRMASVAHRLADQK